MTNLQLMLSIGVPSILILLSWLQTNVRLLDLKENVNQRFQQVDQRFQQLESRLTHLESDYKEFYGLQKKLEGRVDELSRR